MADFITLDEYKEAQGIVNPKEDFRISALIPSVSQLIKTYCGNSIIDYFSVDNTEFINIDWDTNLVQLTESPLVSITSVEERSSYSSGYSVLSAVNFEYYIDNSTDSIYRTNSSGTSKYWPKGPGAVKIVYKAGYEKPPADLSLAVIDLITYYLRDEHKERRTLAGASAQNVSSTSQRNNVAFPDHIKRVLDLYKNF